MSDLAIISFFMNNIDMKTVGLQRSVIEKFNTDGFDSFAVETPMSHAASMDLAWKHEAFAKYSTLMFLDIDAIPLSSASFAVYRNWAQSGYLVGGAQRSNHIENNQHVFCAPSNVCMTRETYEKIGRPSAEPNARGDVGEEYTFRAEEAGVPVKIFMPLRYSRPVNRMQWETDTRPYWVLKDGQPVYGKGTVYGDYNDNGTPRDLFYHNFQIFHPGEQQEFWNTCEDVLRGTFEARYFTSTFQIKKV